ncbi:MAG: hypothetical protein AB2551_10965 [Candidatus Thiodiazotropha sp.]
MSRAKPTNVLALVPDKAPDKSVNTPVSSMSSFSRKLAAHPDAKQASALVEQQAGLEFDQQQGAELEQAKLALTELDTRWKASSATMEELEKKKAGTKRYIKTGALHSGKEVDMVRWSDWRTKDQLLLVFTVSLLVLASFMGAGNVYTNLMSSGNPVFLDDPWLAVMLSTLLPIGSAAIKFVTNFMNYGSSRRRYAISVYVLTLIALVIWSVLFAQNFTGVSGDIDWNSLGTSNDNGSALVWAQLVVEMLAASALFLAAEDIYIRYSPDMFIENPEYIEVVKAIEAHLPAHEKLRQQRASTHGRVVELSASRHSTINRAVADYLAMRSRYTAANE